MPYLMIDDFAQGIDLRKSAVTAKAGSLRRLENAVITAGGEIAKRPMFASLGTLPAGETFGLAHKGTSLWVFGTLPPGSVSALPDNVSYHQLNVSSVTIDRVLDVQVFKSKFYVVARMSDASVRHFYDGTEVADANAQGASVYAHQSKLYAVDAENLRFSAVLDATDWTAGTGAGLIDVTTEDAASDDLVGLERYYNYLALFARNVVQIWATDPDPANNALIQTLGNIGLVAPQAVARYGNGDVLFLSNTGIRSLRARDASNAASLNDVGAPVDALIAEWRSVLTPDVAEKIKALIDPLTGRFWMVWGTEVAVLSTFPGTKISAWSRFGVGSVVDHAVSAGSRIVLRCGNELLLYGATPQAGVNPFDPTSQTGLNVNNYDNTTALVQTPQMDAGDPAALKRWTGLDMTVQGTWDVHVNPTTDPDAGWTKVATVTDHTWQHGRIPVDMEGTHLGVRLVSQGATAAVVSNMALHYDKGETS